MGTYIDSAIWDDEWWINLSWDARCLWWQLLSLKIPLSGIFILTEGKTTDMKVPIERIEELLNELGDKILYDPKTKYIFIKNYLKRVCENANEKQAKNISKTLKDLKNCDDIKKAFLIKYSYLLKKYPDIFKWCKYRGMNRGIYTPMDTLSKTNNQYIYKKRGIRGEEKYKELETFIDGHIYYYDPESGKQVKYAKPSIIKAKKIWDKLTEEERKQATKKREAYEKQCREKQKPHAPANINKYLEEKKWEGIEDFNPEWQQESISKELEDTPLLVLVERRDRRLAKEKEEKTKGDK